MFASMDFWQTFLSPSSQKNGSKQQKSSSPRLTRKKKKKGDTPSREMEQAKQGKGHSWFNHKRSTSSPSSKSSGTGSSSSCQGYPKIPNNVNRNVWKVFNDELDQVTTWLKEAVEFTECWQAPSHGIPSIRVQLERHLAFSLEVQTHQNQTERVVLQGQDIIEQSPSLASSLGPRLEAMVREWNLLERSLDIQAKQIKEALAVVEASINTGFKGRCDDLLVEETRDAIEFMRIKLRRNQGRSSPVNVSFSHTKTNPTDTTTQSPPQSSRFSPSCTSNSSPLSSSPEFEVLYNELSDWLNDMHLAVSDSADMRVSEHHKQHMCKGYEQELQLREVSRSKLQRKGIQLMASKPRLADDISTKLESLNQQWLALQQHIAPSPLLARKASTSSPAACVFGSAEQAMSMALEVEDVIGQLRTWLTQIEGRLFETDGDMSDVGQLETRLRSLQNIKDEIDHNNQSIDVVLKLCSLLQDDDWYLSTHQRERESLQLGAINVERRWQNIKTHSEEMLCHVRQALETTKAYSSGTSSGDEQRSTTPDLPFIMEESDHEEAKLQLSQSENSIHLIHSRFQPSGAKDDDMVDGYGNRMHNQGRTIEYDDILVAREAFSENDAFSISDASEVSAEDFAFDDHLPLKDEEDEEGELDDDLVLPLSETPDIMELTDEMLDAYLQLEKDFLQEVEDEMEEEEKTSKAAAALEFWSMSPREEHMLKAEDLQKMHAALKGQIEEQKIEEGDGVEEEKEDEMSFENMCNAYSEAVANLEEHHGRLDSVGSDFLSEEAEEALECLASDEDIGDEYDADLEDECFFTEDAVHSTTELLDIMYTEETQEFNDDFAGWMIGSMEDVAEYPDSLEMESFTSDESSERKESSHLQNSKEEEEEEVEEEEVHDGMEDDLPEICADDSIFSSEEDASASPPTLLSTWPQENPHFFPPISNESSTNSLFSSLKSLSSSPDAQSFFKGSRLFPSLLSNDEASSSPRYEEEETTPGIPFRRHSLGQRRHSQWSNGPTEKEEEKDNLLEITGISLSHMYESLDFVTELVHQIAPEEKDRSPDQNSRFSDFSDALGRAEVKTSHSLSDSFDIVSNIVRRMVPSYDEDLDSVEERSSAGKQTDSMEEVDSCSQSEGLQEVIEAASNTTLSDSLPLSHSLWQDYMQTCTGSFNFTWPAGEAHCDRDCTELASIQAAVKHTLSKALKGEDEEESSIMSPEQGKKSKKNKRNKRKSGSSVSDTQSVQTEGSCTGSCDTGFNSLLSTDDEKSTHDTPKLSEVDSPCTVVDENDTSLNKSGYMSYVSQIAEACSEGNLDQYLSTQKHKQCYLWSVPPPAEDSPQEAALKEEIMGLEKEVNDLLLTTEELESKWELDSQATDNTDRLIEATNTLVEELKSGKNLEAGDLEEDQVGSWKDVIVLWMDKNGRVRDAETQGCTPITVSPDYLHSEGGHMTPIIEEITSMEALEAHQKPAILPHQKPAILPSQHQDLDMVDHPGSATHSPHHHPQRTVIYAKDACEQYELPKQSKSFTRRVLGVAFPIQVLLFLCTVLVLVLPSMVVPYHGDCYLSLTDNLMLDASGPVMSYVRGPPPV
ncbi:uncharacterized protein LOC121418356 isoform X2 [Lytechinus variegatus]|uniref:uncharacterized protein LOC121418356 isoform X2 n=1 Tax=Lytechinus variegatus TaxID=7654 RepID=UPI001BB25F26|nr:uncharacterized protein LOC121418356 isoform X2 [Lytechinus variegatus]